MDYAYLSKDYAQELANQFVDIFNGVYNFGRYVQSYVPGSHYVVRYIKNSYQNDPFRSFLELILIVVFVVYVFHKKRQLSQFGNDTLPDAVVEAMVADWEPEPLVPELSDRQAEVLEKTPVLSGANGVHVVLENSPEKKVLNLSSFNFLGLLNTPESKEEAINALRYYGVGTCGPPGFYGTLDVHTELEKDLASFMGTPQAILYSQGFATIGSMIPAFAKRGDIVILDEGLAFSVQKGVHLSRSHVFWYKHNDMVDLERVLAKADAGINAQKRQVVRKFIIVEGISENYGDICPLPKLVELKERYRCRLFVEESCSFGVLGKHGRGVTEHFNIPVNKVDAVVASLANAVGAAGGFCCGSAEIIDHQRLSGLAYCYSASLPGLLARVARLNLKKLEAAEQTRSQLSKNIALFHSKLDVIESVQVSNESDHSSPIIHVRLTAKTRESLGITPCEKEEKSKSSYKPSKVNYLAAAFKGDPTRFGKWWDMEEAVWQRVVDKALQKNILLSVAHYVPTQEMFLPSPSLRIAVTGAISEKEAEDAVTGIVKSINSALV